MEKPACRRCSAEIGHELGAAAAERIAAVDADETAQALADQLDALGYEALAVRRDGETQVEAYNCVFHALAKAHPDVCRFDLAFMEAATGRPIQHLECLVRGGHACRFRLGEREKPASLSATRRRVFGIDVHGSRGGSASPFCSSSIEIRSGERTNAMCPSRGGRLIVTPIDCRCAQVA